MVFGSVNASSTKRPPTRPRPLTEPDRPPKGRWDSQWLVEPLMFTQPARAASAKASAALEVTGEDGGGQAEGGRVRQLKRFCHGGDLDDGHDGGEGLLLAMSISGVTPSSTVASANSCVGMPAARRPPASSRAPLPRASPTCRSNFAATASLLSGPIVVEASKGSPSRTRVFVASTTLSTNSARTDAMHEETLAGGAALAGAQVGRLEGGRAWPDPDRHPPARPWGRFLRARAAASCRPPVTPPRQPVATEPTKPTPATNGCPTTASPTTGPGPGTKLNTPGGAPAAASASARTSTRRREQAVVVGAGTHTTVLPAARAGANTSAPIV